jgi:hypothetical protein
MESADRHIIAEYQHRIDRMKKWGPHKWCASSSTAYWLAFELGTDMHLPCGLSKLNPWDGESLVLACHNLWFTAYIVYCFFDSNSLTVSVTDNVIRGVSLVIQGCPPLPSPVPRLPLQPSPDCTYALLHRALCRDHLLGRDAAVAKVPLFQSRH